MEGHYARKSLVGPDIPSDLLKWMLLLSSGVKSHRSRYEQATRVRSVDEKSE